LLQLEPKANGLFAIRNNRGLYMSKQNSHVVWTNNCSTQEQWKIESESANLTKAAGVDPVNGQYYAIVHVNSGGFIGSERKEGS